MTNTVISYPIPLYSNLPIEAENFQPSRFVISALTLGRTTIVQTDGNHNYVIGQEVRLIIPGNSGSTQLNEKKGIVLSIPNTDEVEININSSQNVDLFTSPASGTQPQILAIGNINTGQINNNESQNIISYIPGSFITIS